MAVLLSTVRLIVLQVDNYKTDLANIISTMIDAPCSIGSMRINIYGLTPKLLLNGIDIQAIQGNKPAVLLKQIQLRFDVLDFILDWDVMGAIRISLIDAEFSVTRKTNGSIAINGLRAGGKQPTWLLERGQYAMINSSVVWQDQSRKGEPLQLHGVDIFIDNELPEEQHKINIALNLPHSVGNSMRLSMLFNGNIFHSNDVNGQLYAYGDSINLHKMFTGELPLQLKLKKGQGSFELWSHWQNSQLLSIVGKTELNNSHLAFQNGKTLQLQSAGLQFLFRQSQNSWRLAVKALDLQNSHTTYALRNFSIWTAKRQAEKAGSWSLRFDRLDIARTLYWLNLSGQLPKQTQLWIKRYQPAALFENFQLLIDTENKQFAVDGQFEQLNIAPYASYPGIKNLQGMLSGTHEKGQLQLITNNLQLAFPKSFKHALKADILAGNLHWRQEEDVFTIASPALNIHTGDFTSRIRGRIQIPKTKQAKLFIDAQAAFGQIDDIRSLIDYLPDKKIPQNNMAWIKKAFVSGRMHQAEILFHGQPQAFPFAEKQGRFEVNMALSDFAVDYNSHWPPVSNMTASANLNGDRLQVDVLKGKVMGAEFYDSTGIIPSFFHSDYIHLDAHIQGSLQQSIDFLENSPLAHRIEPITNSVELSGENRIDVKMQIKRHDGVKDKVNGSAHIEQANMLIKGINVPVAELTGELQFDEKAVTSDGIDGQTLGYPVSMRIDGFGDYYTVTARGKTDVTHLKEVQALDIWELTEGSLQYHALLSVPYDPGKQVNLRIDSDLQGFRFNAPAPLLKKPEDNRGFRAWLQFKQGRLLPLKIKYGNSLTAAFEIDTQQHALYSSNIVIGSNWAEFLHAEDHQLRFHMDAFHLDDWLALTGNNNNKGDELVDKLHLQTDNFFWQGKNYGKVKLDLQKEKQQWVGNLQSELSKGLILLPLKWQADKKITLDLHFINLDALPTTSMNPGEKHSDTANTTMLASDFPLLKISSERLFWKSVNLGQLNIDTKKISDGILFETFTIQHQDRRLALYGSSWTQQHGSNASNLTGTLEIEDFGIFLSELKISNNVRDSHANFDFTANWPGAPFDFELSTIKLGVDLKIGSGRMLGIEPGIGRLLGFLNIEHMLRRLQLDFSDIYAEGLSYDSINGHVDIADGFAKTESIMIDSIPAIIKVSGRTGLLNKELDQRVTVVPKSSAAIPIAGTIVKGVTALVAETFTGSNQDGLFFGTQYAIKGTWDNAEVIPLHENDGLLRKAWFGITDFSWLQKNESNRVKK